MLREHEAWFHNHFKREELWHRLNWAHVMNGNNPWCIRFIHNYPIVKSWTGPAYQGLPVNIWTDQIGVQWNSYPKQKQTLWQDSRNILAAVFHSNYILQCDMQNVLTQSLCPVINLYGNFSVQSYHFSASNLHICLVTILLVKSPELPRRQVKSTIQNSFQDEE